MSPSSPPSPRGPPPASPAAATADTLRGLKGSERAKVLNNSSGNISCGLSEGITRQAMQAGREAGRQAGRRQAQARRERARSRFASSKCDKSLMLFSPLCPVIYSPSCSFDCRLPTLTLTQTPRKDHDLPLSIKITLKMSGFFER